MFFPFVLFIVAIALNFSLQNQVVVNGQNIHCPLGCKCSSSVWNCRKSGLWQWPTDSLVGQVFGIVSLDVSGNDLLSTLPDYPLVDKLPNLKRLDIRGLPVPCHALFCLELGGVFVHSECPPGVKSTCKAPPCCFINSASTDISRFGISIPTKDLFRPTFPSTGVSVPVSKPRQTTTSELTLVTSVPAFARPVLTEISLPVSLPALTHRLTPFELITMSVTETTLLPEILNFSTSSDAPSYLKSFSGADASPVSGRTGLNPVLITYSSNLSVPSAFADPTEAFPLSAAGKEQSSQTVIPVDVDAKRLPTDDAKSFSVMHSSTDVIRPFHTVLNVTNGSRSDVFSQLSPVTNLASVIMLTPVGEKTTPKMDVKLNDVYSTSPVPSAFISVSRNSFDANAIAGGPDMKTPGLIADQINITLTNNTEQSHYQVDRVLNRAKTVLADLEALTKIANFSPAVTTSGPKAKPHSDDLTTTPLLVSDSTMTAPDKTDDHTCEPCLTCDVPSNEKRRILEATSRDYRIGLIVTSAIMVALLAAGVVHRFWWQPRVTTRLLEESRTMALEEMERPVFRRVATSTPRREPSALPNFPETPVGADNEAGYSGGIVNENVDLAATVLAPAGRHDEIPASGSLTVVDNKKSKTNATKKNGTKRSFEVPETPLRIQPSRTVKITKK